MPVADHDFDPDDDNIPPILRERIESWQDYPPSTQFQQYGPINRYLNLKFNHDDHMVKPQALFREPVPEPDAELIAEYGTGFDDGLPDDPDDANTVEDLRAYIHKGDISIDSTHFGEIPFRLARTIDTIEDGLQVWWTSESRTVIKSTLTLWFALSWATLVSPSPGTRKRIGFSS